MDAASILIAVGLALLVGAFIARPLLAPNQRTPIPPHLPTALIVERESILAALRELDFDHTTGKVADEDYAPQRAALVARGVAILQQLDELASAPSRSVEDQLEAEVRARRVDAKPALLICPHCGTPRRVNDLFCAKCGTLLPGAA